MSFSSNVICNPPPPATPAVKALSAALWALPVLISVTCLAASPSKTGTALASLFKGKEQPIVLASVMLSAERALEPERFKKVASTPYFRSLMDRRLRNDFRFPMKLAYQAEAAADETAAPVMARADVAVKSTMKVDMAVRRTATETAGISRETVASITRDMHNVATAPLVETRYFDDARVASANMLSADGMTIVLSGINPPKPGSKCRRLDGVMLDCAERAEARLAVLLIDRRIRCRISAPLQDGVVVGQCQAGKIDIAHDLLRNGLANRATAGKSRTML
jgi:endonuclease YncB( thermonuclease family)